ncbi:unnamed protein product [Closterium sp. Naga37s-1]|nr:unnamed protein product [Closterium sp. Naga37s-1]
MDQNDKKRRVDNGSGASEFVLNEMEMRKMLEMLSKEDLVSLLLDAALKHETVAEQVMAIASTNVANRKLFVRGLAWETSSETLLAAFEQYGEIEEGAVITDRTTGRSRGFGFVTFKSSESAYMALREPTKMIDGRAAMCNLAAAGPTSHPTATSVAAASSHGGGGGDSGYQYRPSYSSGADLVYRKLYVWGLHFDTTNETFKDYFSQYGEIEEGAVAFDRETHKSRGFGFVTYRSADDARKALVEPTKFIDGRKVQVKYALDGTKEKNAFAQAQAQLQQQQQLAAALTGVALQNPLAFSPYAFPGGLPASAFGSAGLQGMGFPTAATGAAGAAAGGQSPGQQNQAAAAAAAARQYVSSLGAAASGAGAAGGAAGTGGVQVSYGFGSVAPGGLGTTFFTQ